MDNNSQVKETAVDIELGARLNTQASPTFNDDQPKQLEATVVEAQEVIIPPAPPKKEVVVDINEVTSDNPGAYRLNTALSDSPNDFINQPTKEFVPPVTGAPASGSRMINGPNATNPGSDPGGNPFNTGAAATGKKSKEEFRKGVTVMIRLLDFLLVWALGKFVAKGKLNYSQSKGSTELLEESVTELLYDKQSVISPWWIFWMGLAAAYAPLIFLAFEERKKNDLEEKRLAEYNRKQAATAKLTEDIDAKRAQDAFDASQRKAAETRKAQPMSTGPITTPIFPPSGDMDAGSGLIKVVDVMPSQSDPVAAIKSQPIKLDYDALHLIYPHLHKRNGRLYWPKKDGGFIEAKFDKITGKLKNRVGNPKANHLK